MVSREQQRMKPAADNDQRKHGEVGAAAGLLITNNKTCAAAACVSCAHATPLQQQHRHNAWRPVSLCTRTALPDVLEDAGPFHTIVQYLGLARIAATTAAAAGMCDVCVWDAWWCALDDGVVCRL